MLQMSFQSNPVPSLRLHSTKGWLTFISQTFIYRFNKISDSRNDPPVSFPSLHVHYTAKQYPLLGRSYALFFFGAGVINIETNIHGARNAAGRPHSALTLFHWQPCTPARHIFSCPVSKLNLRHIV